MKAVVTLTLFLPCLALLLSNLSISVATVPPLPRPSPFRPLCVSQLALANYACASVIPSLPFTDPPMPTTASSTIPQPSEILYHLAATKDDGHSVAPPTGRGKPGEATGGGSDEDDDNDDDDDDDQRNHHHHHHHRNHRSSSHDGGGGRRDRHRHRRGGHGRRGGHHDHGRRRGDDNDDNDDDNDGDGNGNSNSNGNGNGNGNGGGGGEHGGGGMERDQRPASPAENNCCKWVGDVDDECVCELLFRLPTFLARPIHEYTIIVSEWCKITYSCGGRPRP